MGVTTRDGAIVRTKRKPSSLPSDSNSGSLKYAEEKKYGGDQRDIYKTFPKEPNNFVSFQKGTINKRSDNDNEDSSIFANDYADLGNRKFFTNR